MKKVGILCLLTALAFSMIGLFPIFKLFQYQIRQNIKAKIKSELSSQELHQISFAKNDVIDWERKGKEFRLHNQLFDIVRTEEKNGSIIYWCINDKQERKLFEHLDDLTQKNTDNSSPIASWIKSLFQLLSLLPHTLQEFSFVQIVYQKNRLFHYDQQLCAGYENGDYHPPQKLA